MSALLVALALVAGSARAQEGEPAGLVYAPRAGSTITKDYTLEHTLVMRELVTEVGGEERASQRLLEFRTSLQLQLLDRLRAVDGGRVTELERTLVSCEFRGSASSLGVEEDDERARVGRFIASSSLVGLPVAFVWVPDLAEYGRHYTEEEGLVEHLADLHEETDLRGLLPEPGAPTEVGAEWSAPAEALAPALAPGGELPLEFSRSEDPLLQRTLTMGVGGGLHELFPGTWSGQVRARLAERLEQDGVRLARIELDVDVGVAHDLTERARNRLTAVELLRGVQIESSRMEVRLQGTGTLTWNLDAGTLHAFELVADESVRSTVETFVADGESEVREVQRLLLEGAFECTVSAEVRLPRPKRSGDE